MTDAREHFDAIVIGSGFGGSVMTHRLAAAGMSVCLLERGRRYPPGSFARSPREMQGNFWDPAGGRHGLFQVWRFAGIDGLVSAGLGGGSLIYANVLLRKDADWFVRRRDDGSLEDWPITREDLEDHYNQVEEILAPQIYPLDREPYNVTSKTLALQEAAHTAGLEWFLPPLAVTFANAGQDPIPGEPIKRGEDNLHHRSRTTCRLCGECDIGCNYGSKNTLDYNYLSLACTEGADIRDLCEVREFEPAESGGFVVRYVEHQVGREGVPTDTSKLPTLSISADRLILSAGTFGSTYLLLKNRGRFPGLSNKLGHFVSGNGDFLGFIHDAHQSEAGVRSPRVLAASKGSVITSTVRVPRAGGRGGFYIQDGGYPGMVDWLVEAASGVNLVHRAARFAETRIVDRVVGDHDTSLDAQIEALLGDAHRSSSLLPLLGMGLDTPDGIFTLDEATQHLQLDWSSRHSDQFFEQVEDAMRTLASHLDAKFQVDPIWYLHKKVITVHPVGGCAIGRGKDDGVIDVQGEVFDYPGFVCADGSVMPGPVGPNPSLTIAAMSNKFAEYQINR